MNFRVLERQRDYVVLAHPARRLFEAEIAPRRTRVPHPSCADRCLSYHRACNPCGLLEESDLEQWGLRIPT